MLAPHAEETRLAALHALQLLDTPSETAFDEAVSLAAAVCGVQMAAVNLLDRDRQWFKAKVGLDASEMPRKGAFCEQLMGETQPLVVPDASLDPRFDSSPFVTGNPHLRFYAGMPLNTVEGQTLGTLCVLDTVPRELSPVQLAALATIGRQVSAQIELGRQLQILSVLQQEKESVEREARATHLRFRAFMDFCPMIGFIKDREGRFLYYNRQFQERFAISETEWVGKGDYDLFPPEYAAKYHQHDLEILDSGQPRVIEETSPGPNETTLHWRTYKFPVSNPGGEALLGGMSLEVSEERKAALALEQSHAELTEANRKLTELSMTDALTGLRNRRAFEERVRSELEMTGDGGQLSIILIDVDHFKSFNDSFGHLVGDDILRMLSKLMEQNVRYSDTCARIGGEEFAIVLPSTSLTDAAMLAERIRCTVTSFGWRHRPVTISAGVATLENSSSNADGLFAAADEVLYRAKHLGRNRVEFRMVA